MTHGDYPDALDLFVRSVEGTVHSLAAATGREAEAAGVAAGAVAKDAPERLALEAQARDELRPGFTWSAGAVVAFLFVGAYATLGLSLLASYRKLRVRHPAAETLAEMSDLQRIHLMERLDRALLMTLYLGGKHNASSVAKNGRLWRSQLEHLRGGYISLSECESPAYVVEAAEGKLAVIEELLANAESRASRKAEARVLAERAATRWDKLGAASDAERCRRIAR